MVLGVLMTFTSHCSPGASFALQKLHLPPEICPSSLDNLGLAGIYCHVLISSTEYFFFPSFQFHIDGIVQCTISNSIFQDPRMQPWPCQWMVLLCLACVFSMPWCEAGISDCLQRQEEFGGKETGKNLK